jgi:hypothetical protein
VTRGLSSAQNTYLAGDALVAVTLIDIGVNSASDIAYTDAPFDVVYDGTTYQAQGNFMGISESSETADLQITNINIVISALDINNVRTLARSEQINQDVSVYRTFLNPTDNALIGDSAGDQAILIFKGKIAGYRITDANDTATITLEVASQFANFNRKTGRRTNNASLQREHATDFGFQYSHETLQDIRWGKV